MALIKIGGIDMPNPSTYQVGTEDLDSENSKRTEDGIMRRDRIRAEVYSLSLSWEALTAEQLTTVATALRPAAFNVTFFDPVTCTEKTISAYAAKKSAELVRKMNESNKTKSYWNYTATITQN